MKRLDIYLMGNDFRADLHCHSLYSDGTDSPEKILLLAKEQKLSGISITDHDTLNAYTPDLQTLAEELDLYLLPGVEISSTFVGKTVHVLAYGKKLLCDSFRCFLKEIQVDREARNRNILEKLNQIGFEISENDLLEVSKKHANYKGKTIGRPHIAQVMIEKGFVASIQEAFNKYLGDSGKCFAGGMKHHPKDVIDKIHAAGGYAIVAHPHFYKRRNFVDALLNLPFDGIECYYSRLASFYEKKWIDIAKKKNKLITGGSDFHGSIKPHIILGCSWVNKETFFSLYE